MADFCKQCSVELFGKDFRELAELITQEDADKGLVSASVICEGCGVIQVNRDGECVSADCDKPGHNVIKRN